MEDDAIIKQMDEKIKAAKKLKIAAVKRYISLVKAYKLLSGEGYEVAKKKGHVTEETPSESTTNDSKP